MNLKEFKKMLNSIPKEYDNALVVYSADSEGNSFEPVHFSPSGGYYSEDRSEFVTPDEKKYLKESDDTVKAVCIN